GIAFAASELFGVSFALGAFCAGVVVSESDHSHRAAEQAKPLEDAFAVLFFLSVGMLFDPGILVRHPFQVLAVLAVILLGKSIAAFAIVRLAGYPAATALTVAASLAQIGEFSFMLAALGAALFYCDALITPAISVLSAVEGLENLNPDTAKAVVPVTLLIIIALFAIQHRGTERVGRLFGPIMALWFIVLAVTGVQAMLRHPSVLAALSPSYGVLLLLQRPGVALAILGGVFLAMTGGEALYADMGHFGKRPVRVAWFFVVWPALVLNYFGQGALILDRPEAAHLPLYQLVPVSMLPLMVVLATAATIIASQATITGAFSVTRQCIQLDLLPRLRIRQTSAREHSQIYVPAVNWLVLLAVCLFVLGFRSSDALGAAYGAAVAGTMFITTLLGAQLALAQWRWPHWRVAAVFGPLMLVDLVYLTGNLTKFSQGAWVPLTLASVLFFVFMIWRSGRRLLRRALRSVAVPLSQLPKLLADVARVPGTAVFLASDPDHVPTALLRNLEHNHVAHERIVFLNVEITRSPRQDPADRVRIATLMPEIYTITARFGFMETPDVSEALKQCR
ncbi:MAG TPA: KUP/HAK/KT family potassium transporter, partial [Steroidobacteraceae bacterium]|nr:KUP/HAK/KT family potassium transporter [Steroidobacteraceae bacterium]